MKFVVFLALLGVVAARPHVVTVGTPGETDSSATKVVAYNYPVYGGFPYFYPNYPYGSPFTFPFAHGSPVVTVPRTKRSAEPEAEPEPEAEADPEADPFFYTPFPFPTPTTYNFPTAGAYNFPTTTTTFKFPTTTTTYKFPTSGFPVATPYTSGFPFQHSFPFQYTFVADKTVKTA